MHHRRKIIAGAAGVLLLVALLFPLARLLSLGQEESRADNNWIADMYAWQNAYEKESVSTTVEPMMEIEDIWAIEDEREEAESALIFEMKNGMDALGYDAKNQTFYCSIGMDGEEWPQLSLQARGVPGVRLAWVDDYTYDFCRDAVREGYRYELLAFTDTEYIYMGIVFTGLPLVVLHTQTGCPIGDEYAPVRVNISSAEYETLDSVALAHLRGGNCEKPIEKMSYRLELHELSLKGRDAKRAESVLGMEADTDWLLLANAQDETAVANYLAWDLWKKWNPDEQAPLLLDSRLVEAFVDDEYVGLYQLMQRVKPDDELIRMGGHVETDYVTRMVSEVNVDEKPFVDWQQRSGFLLEYRYGPRGRAADAFAHMEDFVRLSELETFPNRIGDEEFAALAERCVDVEEVMNYFAFFQAATLRDNVFNNMYIFALRGDDGLHRYRIGPWDMDLAFLVPRSADELNEGSFVDLSMVLPVRMLELNVMDSREIFEKIWKEKRADILSDDAFYTWFLNVEEYVNNSGAYLRETQKWYGQAQTLNLSDMAYYASWHLENVEAVMWEYYSMDLKDSAEQ